MAQMIGGALVVAVFLYALPVEILRARRGGFEGFAPAVPLDVLRLVFVVLAVADLALIRFIRSRILAAQARGGLPSASASTPQQVQAASIVSLAMCLAVAVYGLALFLIGGRPLDFYGFALVSLVSLAVYFPRRWQWEQWARGDGRSR